MIETTLKEKLEIIGAVGPVLAELNRFGETLFQINTEARVAARMMIDKGVEGAEAQLMPLEGEMREQTQDLSSRVHFMSQVVWEILDSICEERGFVHYKKREDAPA